MDSKVYNDLLLTNTAAEVVTIIARDFWYYFALKCIQASMAVLFIVALNLVLIPLAILIPQLILMPWKFIASYFYVKQYNTFVEKRGQVHSFNFHIDVFRPSHIQLFELIICILIVGGGWWICIAVVGGGFGGTFSSLGISFVIATAIWKGWGSPFISYVKIKCHDLHEIGDKVDVKEFKFLITAISCAFVAYIKLDKNGNLPPVDQRATGTMSPDDILYKYAYVDHIGTADEMTMNELHALQNYGQIWLRPTIFGKEL